MPLADAKLRFQVLNDHRQAILEKLSSWGWLPALRSEGPGFMPNGTAPLLRLICRVIANQSRMTASSEASSLSGKRRPQRLKLCGYTSGRNDGTTSAQSKLAFKETETC